MLQGVAPENSSNIRIDLLSVTQISHAQNSSYKFIGASIKSSAKMIRVSWPHLPHLDLMGFVCTAHSENRVPAQWRQPVAATDRDLTVNFVNRSSFVSCSGGVTRSRIDGILHH